MGKRVKNAAASAAGVGDSGGYSPIAGSSGSRSGATIP